MLDNVNVFVGFNHVGFSATDGTLALAQVRAADADADSRSYLTAKAILGSAAFSGIPAFTAANATNLALELNAADDPGNPFLPALDWTAALDLDQDGMFGETLTLGGLTWTMTASCCAPAARWISPF